MNGTMRQMVMEGPRKSTIIEVPIPQFKENEMLVKVTLTGMCHSEWYPWATAKKGDILGHEAVGVVAEVGTEVEGFKVGDRVTGLGGGAYREYIVVDPRKWFHIPDDLKDEDVITEPLACILSAVTKLPVQLVGDTVAVVGCGYMGLGSIALFKAMGYGNIIAVDKRPEALENAGRFGATETYLPDELPESYISDFETIGKADLTRSSNNEELWELGIPTVLEFTGTEDGLALAGRLTQVHGRLGIGGYHNDGLRSVDYKLWNFKAITTINCHERRVLYEAGICKRCIELLEKKIWNFTGVTKIYDMKDFDKVSEMMEFHTDGFIKAAIRP